MKERKKTLIKKNRLTRRRFWREISAKIFGAGVWGSCVWGIGARGANAGDEIGRFWRDLTAPDEDDVISKRPLAKLPSADANALRPGDVLAARWADERKNTSPGYWNHLAIVVDDGRRVVEAQRVANGAISTPVEQFLSRYSEICAARYFCSWKAANAARFAEGRVAERMVAAPLRREDGENESKSWGQKLDGVQTGPKYSRFASIWPNVSGDSTTENCVSLIRRAYWAATGIDYRWRTPDSFVFNDQSSDFKILGLF